ncbi:MAG: lytic transglycosylase domain-containing protein [Clostridia bacterium]|jgi:soluble lytic murein transglycosylase|nr:lytic transglycosylase domain-containing protein [Clostridia bacterium]
MIVIFIDIPTKIQKIVYKKQYSEYVTKYANEYNIDENLIYAVIKAESNFKNDAKSSKDAMGLMQLMKDTAKEVSQKINLQIDDDKIEQKLLDVEININLGTKYLSDLIDRYQNIELAVTAYNAGIGTVNNWIEKGIIKSDGSDIENIPYKETNNYVRKILRDYKIYSNL